MLSQFSFFVDSAQNQELCIEYLLILGLIQFQIVMIHSEANIINM